jgi:hypothetical protein
MNIQKLKEELIYLTGVINGAGVELPSPELFSEINEILKGGVKDETRKD